MNEILKNIPISGIITSGEIYILNPEGDPRHNPGPIEFIYTLTCDEHILPALELEFCILDELYALRKFCRYGEILDGVYEFHFRCYDKEGEEEVGYSMFLHRLSTLSQQQALFKHLLNDSESATTSS